MSALLVAMVAAGFLKTTYIDPFTDEKTRAATLGDVKGERVQVYCSGDRKLRYVVEIASKSMLYVDEFTPNIGRRQPVRFDDEQPINMRFRYGSDEVFITGKDAEDFVAGLRRASRMRFEIFDWRNRGHLYDLTTNNAPYVLEWVDETCPR